MRMGLRFLFPVLASSCLALAGTLVLAEPARVARHFESLKEIRERGVVMQQWESSCAAATLATVLTYGFGDPVSERQVALGMLAKTDAAKVKAQSGFSMLDMKRFVEARGYRGSAYQNLSLLDLELFHAPIVPINRHGYHHYVVFNGVHGAAVLLADPAFGNFELPLARFAEVWMDGLAFTIERREDKLDVPFER